MPSPERNTLQRLCELNNCFIQRLTTVADGLEPQHRRTLRTAAGTKCLGKWLKRLDLGVESPMRRRLEFPRRDSMFTRWFHMRRRTLRRLFTATKSCGVKCQDMLTLLREVDRLHRIRVAVLEEEHVRARCLREKQCLQGWQIRGHDALGRQTLRVFDAIEFRGRIVGWLPATSEDPELFFNYMEDGDAEDLETPETEAAIQAYSDWTVDSWKTLALAVPDARVLGSDDGLRSTGSFEHVSSRNAASLCSHQSGSGPEVVLFAPPMTTIPQCESIRELDPLLTRPHVQTSGGVALPEDCERVRPNTMIKLDTSTILAVRRLQNGRRQGAFANQRIAQGVLIPIVGIVYSPEDQLVKNSGYEFEVAVAGRKGCSLLADMECGATYVNDFCGPYCAEIRARMKHTQNVCLVRDKNSPRLWWKTMREILEEEELIGSYGDVFWTGPKSRVYP